MKKGICYRRGGQNCFILNPFFVQNEDQAVLDQLIGKYIAVTFETALYYFQVGKAWYENNELHVSAYGKVTLVDMLTENWLQQLVSFQQAEAESEE